MMSSASAQHFLSKHLQRQRSVISLLKRTTNNRRILHSSTDTKATTAATSTSSRGKKRILHSSAMTLNSAAAPAMNATACSASVSSSRSSAITRPSSRQLQTAFVSAAIPMCAFGFMDNLIMIQAGGYIDATFGAAFGLATLSAAALGQVVSDVSGVLFGSTVERLVGGRTAATTTAIKPLTHAQRQLPLVKNVVMAGSVVGIIVGCSIGALSLLFVDLEARDRQEKEQELAVIVCQMMEDPRAILHTATAAGANGKYESIQKAASDQVILRDNGKWYIPVVKQNNDGTQTTLGVVECSAATMKDESTLEMTAKHLAIFMSK